MQAVAQVTRRLAGKLNHVGVGLKGSESRALLLVRREVKELPSGQHNELQRTRLMIAPERMAVLRVPFDIKQYHGRFVKGSRAPRTTGFHASVKADKGLPENVPSSSAFSSQQAYYPLADAATFVTRYGVDNFGSLLD